MRYFTGFLIAIGLIILIFVIILKGGGTKPKLLNLNSYANSNAAVQLTIGGPVTADQTHQEIVMTVSASESSIQMLQGYQGVVTASKYYQNNPNAYNVFLHALTLEGFTKGVSSTNLNAEIGVCSSSERYVISLTESDSTVAEYWSSACGGGTYGGDLNGTINLFEQQFPDFGVITQNFNY